MIYSTILLNLIGLYDVDREERAAINDYKQSYLYNDTYKKCAALHHVTRLFGEPLNCMNDAFLIASFETLDGKTEAAHSPDMIHFIRKMRFPSESLSSAEVVSNQHGQVISVEAILSGNETPQSMREIAKKISSKYGQPDVNPPNPQMPIWGWITKDGFEIRLFRDTATQENKFSITHQGAYHTLRGMKDSEFIE
ncbi:hypothetical protein [Photobacterium galatheae]|uniref:Uncharacterized protein n=1 Tax=Photobacterium galatheae TaxID=1654360 RepID=A0A066RT27_9GAMM|nr:hypothetical protein [Photobacterium galatheae]KDM90847.1 hypothetical protein EA58_13890 [Photobacterium galatheae]MCM0149185.1 hypothetical protein [Photobacterium galatheae]